MNQMPRPNNSPDEHPAVNEPDPQLSKDRYQSDELFGERKEILIVHNQEVYRLRRTRHDKLILYK